jgi:hypothetical protein
MATYAKRVFPIAYVSPVHALNILVMCDGLTADQEAEFKSLCKQLVDRLLAMTPFNLTRYYPGWVNVYRHFTPSIAGASKTAFGATFNLSSKVLAIDPALVSAEIKLLKIRGQQGESDKAATSLWPPGDRPVDVGDSSVYGAGIVVILVRSMFPGFDFVGETEHPGRRGLEVEATSHPYIVATTTDGNWHQVVARAIAYRLGLGDEFELEDSGGKSFLKPTLRDGLIINVTYPNLLYAETVSTGPPTPLDLKWYDELRESEQRKPLSVRAHTGSGPDYTDYAPVSGGPEIQLVEGGASYRTKVYRSAPDCLLRRRIGGHLSTGLSLKKRELQFCTICRRYLRGIITGQRMHAVSWLKPVSKQALVYDQIKWQSVQKIDKKADFPVVLPSIPLLTWGGKKSPGAMYATEPIWSFILEAGASVGGLRISDLKLAGQPLLDSGKAPGEDIARLVEFRDLGVTFGDGSTVKFDVARAFADGRARLEYASRGKLAGDDRFLHGVKLTLEDDFGGICRVSVAMSLVLRAPDNDIDPVGMVDAVKLYPQIAMTWFKGLQQRVKAFRCCIRMVLNNYHDPDRRGNVLSFFTDSNTSTEDGRERGTLPAPFPNWSFMFDHHRPHVTTNIEVTGVYGPGGDAQWEERYANSRTREYIWPEVQTRTPPFAITLTKLPRQGAYDNFHTHGWMDEVHGGGAHSGGGHGGMSGQPMVHAPFCAEACFHLHWRWSPFAASAAVSPHRFYGWGNTRNSRFAHTIAGAPLIPPNQHLRLAMTHPSADRVDGYLPGKNVVGPANVAVGGTALPALEKAMWYTVDISEPNPDEPQVVMEQGIGQAFAYHLNGEFTGMASLMTFLFPGPDPDDTVMGGRSMEEIYHLVYGFIRYFGTLTRRPQIPEGNYSGQHPSTLSMEEL